MNRDLILFSCLTKTRRFHKTRESVFSSTCSCVPHMVISLFWQAETWLMFGRILRNLHVSPRSCRTKRPWSCCWEQEHRSGWTGRAGASLTFWAYLFVLEGLHQRQHPTEGQREGGTGPPVAVRHLHAAVAEVPLPVCLAADLVLPKDVRYEVSLVKRKTVRNEKWGGGGPAGGPRRHAGLTLAAGWGEVFHQGGEEVVELEEAKKGRR